MSLPQTEKQYCSTTSKGNGNIEVLTQEKSVRMMKRGFFRGKPFQRGNKRMFHVEHLHIDKK